MMYPWIESVIVGVCVGLAAAYLVYRGYASLRRRPTAGCGGSCGCGTNQKADEDRLGRRIDLVQLGRDSMKA